MTIAKNMAIAEREMNPFAIHIINPKKKKWPSRRSHQVPSVLKSRTLHTDSAIGARKWPCIYRLESIDMLKTIMLDLNWDYDSSVKMRGLAHLIL